MGLGSKRLQTRFETEDPSGFRHRWPMILYRRDIVQTRLLSCIAGGLLGVVLTSPINAVLGLAPTLAWVGCAAAGVAVGYMVSMLIDAFAVSSGDNHAETRK
jgi:hypothetical protein